MTFKANLESTSQDKILMGVISHAHGIKGDMLIKSYTENPEDIMAYGPLWDESLNTNFVFKVKHLKDKGVVVHCSGIDDRNQAEALKGTKLYVKRSQMPQSSEEDGFYHSDLIGLKVLDQNEAYLGDVLAIVNFGASDLLEFKPESGASLYVPFTKEAVPVVDLESKLVKIDMAFVAFGKDDE